MMDEELDTIRALISRRSKREPVAYIEGEKEFWSKPFVVRPGILIPRPDTETLVEAALTLIPDDEPMFVADIGAGSGCVGLAIATERPQVKLFATDISPIAIQPVIENAIALGLRERVAPLTGDLLSPIPDSRVIDIVVSNPPYIPSSEIEALAPEILEFEPRGALDGGDDGLDIYRRLIPAAAARATKAVLVEIGAGQEEDVAKLFRDAGLIDVTSHKDLAGIDRVISGLVQKI
jgi:release factor glutamine methyltransferase